MLYGSEEATTNEMGSIEQHRPLQSIYIILHLEQTGGPGFKKLQENTKHSYISDPFIQPHRLKAISRRSQAKPMNLICPRKWR